MVLSKRMKEELKRQQKEAHPSDYVKIKKYTICDPLRKELIKDVFTNKVLTYSAFVKIGDENVYLHEVSMRVVEKFREHGINVSVVEHVGHRRKDNVEDIPMEISCAYGNDYDSGVIVKIAYRGKDEEEALDNEMIVEPMFKKVLKDAGIPLDRVCIESSLLCEMLWSKNKRSDFEGCGYVTKDVADGFKA